DQLKINDSQKMGSANSYASRYNLINALGLTTGEDDDGAAGDTRRGAAPAPKATNVDEFFPVGKHKGQPWDQVPLDYLEWCVGNLTDKPDIIARCKKQIEARSAMDEPAPSVEGEPTLAECARWITNAKGKTELADAWSMVPAKFQTSLDAFYNTRKDELGA
ncbi:MAG: ERF family protein, partial [Hyphomicrobiaceae bacterium]|nr:ERF family protein [Hyphomicrobiaceae bacterium]